MNIVSLYTPYTLMKKPPLDFGGFLYACLFTSQHWFGGEDLKGLSKRRIVRSRLVKYLSIANLFLFILHIRGVTFLK